MRKKSLKLISVGAVLILLFGVCFGILNIYLKYENVTISYTNIKRVEVNSVSPDNHNNNYEPIIVENGKSVRLKKDLVYIVNYYSNDDFSNGSITFSPKDRKDLRITPYFSENKLLNILQTEKSNIHKSVSDKYKQINLFSYKDETLYNFGEWYSTKLTYSGKDIYNSDTLVLVAHKINGLWVVINDPPGIYISSYDHPEIPINILNKLNSF